MSGSLQTTLGNLIPLVYAELGELIASKAEALGNSTTTVVDSALVDKWPNETWKGGTMMILQSENYDEPESEFSIITRFESNNSGNAKFTFSPALTASPDSKKYGFSSTKYPLYQVIEAVNQALRSLGRVVYQNTTTITAANQTEYSLTPVFKHNLPIRVDIQTITNDSNNNEWRELYGWQIQPEGPGSNVLLILPFQPPVGHKLRIWFERVHPAVSTYDDQIYESLDEELVVLATAEKLITWKSTQQGGSDKYLLQKLADVRSRIQIAKVERKALRQRRTPKLLVLNDGIGENDFTYPSP